VVAFLEPFSSLYSLSTSFAGCNLRARRSYGVDGCPPIGAAA
jgi:hypothetical protein